MCAVTKLPLCVLAACSVCWAFTADLDRRRELVEAHRARQELPFRVLGAGEISNLPARYQDISTQWLPRWKAAIRGRPPVDLSEAIERAALPARIRNALHRMHQEARQRGGQEGAEVQRDIEHMVQESRQKKSFHQEEEDDEEDVDMEEDEELQMLESGDVDEEIAEPVAHEVGKEPFWHHPCGKSVNLLVRRSEGGPTRKATRHLSRALERVWQQLNMTVLHYKLQRFDKLYYKVRIGVDEHQYVPNWVPGRQDLMGAQAQAAQSNEELARQLTRMHTQLQKFSVAVEQIAKDQRDYPERHAALFKTQNYVRMLLCEVEWALLSLALPLPEHIPRDIMSPAERYLSDTTAREIRDWGVLLRYRDFLNGWADIVSRAKAGRW